MQLIVLAILLNLSLRQFLLHFHLQANGQSLPTSQTCFFQLRLPSYSTQDILAERLRCAITNCRSIDMDTYMLRNGNVYDSPQTSDDDDLDVDEDIHMYT